MSQSSAAAIRPATLDDLMRHHGKAELIGGRIIPLMATGHRPNQIAKRIVLSLEAHIELIKIGFVYTDNMGFAVPELISGRESFSPDASYYAGPAPANDMDFIAGPPTFAVEVRSKGDYGPAAERELHAKRTDYFAAGTRVIWDVDTEATVIRSYAIDQPTTFETFRSGQLAHAEAALPGWRVAVDRIFG